jgi:hypothetical protein
MSLAMIEIAHLLAVIDAYRNATGVEDTTVSYRVFDDSKKIAALRSGSDLTTSRFNAALAWFASHWPDGAQWPVDVVRPEVERAA